MNCKDFLINADELTYALAAAKVAVCDAEIQLDRAKRRAADAEARYIVAKDRAERELAQLNAELADTDAD